MAGFSVGVMLGLVAILPAAEVSEQMLLAAYGVVVILISAALASTWKAGFMFGLFAIAGESVAESLYFVLALGTDLLLVPFAAGFAFFLGRIPVFLLAGAVGGYLGGEYFADKSGKKRVKKKRRAHLGPRVREVS
jgi:hypothetical protein